VKKLHLKFLIGNMNSALRDNIKIDLDILFTGARFILLRTGIIDWLL